jgi:hypothetical protein
LYYQWLANLHNIELICLLSTFSIFHAWFEDLLAYFARLDVLLYVALQKCNPSAFSVLHREL